MAQLSSQKSRNGNVWYLTRPRAKVLFVVASVVGMGILSEYTYVRRLQSVSDIKAFPDVQRMETVQSADLPHLQNDVTVKFDETQPVEKKETTTGIVSKTEDLFRISNGKATSSSVPMNFFSIVSDPRSGAEYTMGILDQYESICSSGSFPKSALLPNTMPWMANDSVEKGCTLAFMRESILDLTSKPNYGDRCAEGYDASNDEFRNHLMRFCAVIKALDGDHTNRGITQLFVNAFAENTESAFTGCDCPSTTRARVLKISADWVGDNFPIETSYVKGSKMIRLTRQNHFERYMSFVVAHATGQWMIRTEIEKTSQLNAFREKNFVVDIDEMLDQMKAMTQSDEKTNQWVNDNGSQILWIDHSQIRDDPMRSFEKMMEFLGAAALDADARSADVHRLKQITEAGGSLSSFNGTTLLDFIANKDQVTEALWANGYGSFIGLSDKYMPIQYLVFPGSEPYHAANAQSGIHVTVLSSEGNSLNATLTPSARFSAALPVLEHLPSDAIVVLSNAQAGGLNPHIRRVATLFDRISEFRSIFLQGGSNQVIASASHVCCSDAMRNAPPGTLFHPEGRRSGRTCQFGECAAAANIDGWSSVMEEILVRQRPNRPDHIYLDGSFIAGTAGNVLRFIQELDILAWEDDRAVLSDYMYRFPDQLVLDYEQHLFARGFGGVVDKMHLDCSSPADDDTTAVTTTQDAASSLFVYTSRWRQSCARLHRPYPHWDGGMAIAPILEHMDRALVHNVSLPGIDRHFDKEILYVVDRAGLWASQVRRDKYRVQPTERFLVAAHQALLAAPSHRWSRLQQVVQSTGFPYWAWYGDWKGCTENGNGSVPLFTTCANTACHNNNVPMPSYMTILEAQPDVAGWYRMFRQFDQQYPWRNKIRKVVWRGALSENDPAKVLGSQRWRLCQLVHSLTDAAQAQQFDVGLTSIPEFLTAQMDLDASAVGGIVKGIASMNDFQQYAAVLDLDGNSWSSRFGTLLCYNSVVLKVQPAYVDYFFPDLVPWQHYVPIQNDLSDLLENVAFVLDPANERIVQDMIAAANRWCAARLTQPALMEDLLDLWEQYVRRLDQNNPHWSRVWDEQKRALFSSSSTIPLVQLQ